MYALFVDLKAAFDNVNRKRLWECLREKGVSEELTGKIEEIYEETKNVVRVNGKESECFWTKKGVRQGCPLSPTLFTVFISDVEEMLKKAQAGGVTVGKEKVWCLAYADDMVLVARDEKGMKEMIKNTERYMKRKELEVNIEKTKVIVFRKRRGRAKEGEWKWRGEKVEQVKEFRYLGFVFNERNTVKAHVRELTKKTNKVIRTIWGIGERKFGHDFRRRMMMYDSLVKNILMYGAEIWGWKEEEEVEKVQDKYLKWVVGVDRETPGYIIREETKRNKMRVEAGKRAVKFEDKMEEREGCRILQECWREKKRGVGVGVGGERQKYYERNGYGLKQIESSRGEGKWMNKELEQRDKDIDIQERRGRIKESRYNAAYGEILSEGVPKYLEGERAKDNRTVARYRCGNEEKENRFWLEEEERKCRMCGRGKETIEHMLRECEAMREEERERKEILNENGAGLGWMKVVERERRRAEGGREN